MNKLEVKIDFRNAFFDKMNKIASKNKKLVNQ